RFAMESGDAIALVGHSRRENLQRDVAIEFQVARAIHLTHSAGAEQRYDLVGTETSTCQRHVRMLAGSYAKRALRALFDRVELFAGVPGKRRVRVLLDEPVEGLLRVRALSRLEIRPAKLHQDAVDRQRPFLALRELLERVDRLVELAGAHLRLREPELGHLSVEPVADLVDHLLIGRR